MNKISLQTACNNRYSSMPEGRTLKAKIAGTSDSVALNAMMNKFFPFGVEKILSNNFHKE
jgi:hypothetical protein